MFGKKKELTREEKHEEFRKNEAYEFLKFIYQADAYFDYGFKTTKYTEQQVDEITEGMRSLLALAYFNYTLSDVLGTELTLEEVIENAIDFYLKARQYAREERGNDG